MNNIFKRLVPLIFSIVGVEGVMANTVLPLLTVTNQSSASIYIFHRQFNCLALLANGTQVLSGVSSTISGVDSQNSSPNCTPMGQHFTNVAVCNSNQYGPTCDWGVITENGPGSNSFSLQMKQAQLFNYKVGSVNNFPTLTVSNSNKK